VRGSAAATASRRRWCSRSWSEPQPSCDNPSMSAARTRAHPRTADILTASAAAVLSVGGALALPALLALEPEPGIRPVSPADATWWLVVAVLVAQAVALLWARRFPLPILAAATLVPLA